MILNKRGEGKKKKKKKEEENSRRRRNSIAKHRDYELLVG